MAQAADAAVVLAGVWLALGPCHAPHAASQLQSVLPLVLGHGDLALQARAQHTLANCLLASATAQELAQNPDW